MAPAFRTSMLTILFLWTCSSSRAQQLRYNKHLSKEVTTLLDSLLDENRYDRRLRPNFGGSPVQIQINIHIKSLGPISETEEDFLMDLYFRQMWTDSRLRFNDTSGLKEFPLNWLFLDKVWKPDTYFVNGKKSYLHSITVPNKFLRLREDGFLTFSMRLTVKARCIMHLRKFPLDSQSCPLEIGSYGYSDYDVQYLWARSGKNPVGREEGVNLAQYDLVDAHNGLTGTSAIFSDNFSVITVHFHLKRATGFYLLQVYVPCALIVSCSWVSFWLDPSAVPARVSLGVTTVLSISTLGFGNRSQMPRTSYATALDWFVIFCFAFVFASMIEYAAINFIEKMKKDITMKAKTKKASSPEPNKAAILEEVREQSGFKSRFKGSLAGKKIATANRWIHQQLKDPWTMSKRPVMKVSEIDLYARRIFPISFAIFNVIYWSCFMYYIGDDEPSSEQNV